MCWACVGHEMIAAEVTTVAVTDEMVNVALLIEQLYQMPQCLVGGPLHVVTDDANVEDRSLEFCRGWVADHDNQYSNNGRTAERDTLCIQILDRLAPFTLPERALITVMHHGDRYTPPGQTRTWNYPEHVDVDPQEFATDGTLTIVWRAT